DDLSLSRREAKHSLRGIAPLPFFELRSHDTHLRVPRTKQHVSDFMGDNYSNDVLQWNSTISRLPFDHFTKQVNDSAGGIRINCVGNSKFSKPNLVAALLFPTD